MFESPLGFMEVVWDKVEPVFRCSQRVAGSSQSQPRSVEYAHQLQQSVVVEPGRAFQGGQIQRHLGFPGCTAVYQFSLAQAINRLSHCVVLAVTTNAN